MTDWLTPRLDQLIALFNARSMDLPDGLFDRKTQFLLNGVSFESLLDRSPDDVLVRMLVRGPAGYRFAAKALQHAMPDAALERGDTGSAADPLEVSVEVWLSGHLRGSGDRFDTVVTIRARLGEAGWIETADAAIEPTGLGRLRAARLLS